MAQIWTFNDLYGEDDDERADRLRSARLAARCPHCGRNPKIGQVHTDDCPTRKDHGTQ